MGNAGRNGGEYYTPRPLIRAMIQVTRPQIGERIYDGAVGSAGFLGEAHDYLRNPQDGGKLTTSQLETLQTRTFYGKEKDPCPVCGCHPCECPCPTCGQHPCICVPEPCPVCGEHPCVCQKNVKIKIKLAEARKLIDAENSDVFDVLAYIAFTLPPISREERVDTHRDEILTSHEEKQQAFLEFVLGEYIKEGVSELDPTKLPDLLNLKYGSIYDATEELGNVSMIRETFVEFQGYLYAQPERKN